MFLEEASIRVAYVRHGVTNLYGLLTVDQERCHPPYKMCWQAHVTEFRNEQFVIAKWMMCLDCNKTWCQVSHARSYTNMFIY